MVDANGRTRSRYCSVESAYASSCLGPLRKAQNLHAATYVRGDVEVQVEMDVFPYLRSLRWFARMHRLVHSASHRPNQGSGLPDLSQ